ncbi:MAG: radical SAM protein [Lachnospiraceae bacterium]|nr:radical SAM protein [Lachnospiraceae bacterium]
MNYYIVADMMIKAIMSSLKLDKLCLFGMGDACNSFLDNSILRNDVEKIFDNDSSKWGGIKNVLSPEYINRDLNALYIIMSMYDEEIGKQLQALGVTNYISYYQVLDFIKVKLGLAHISIKACMIEATNYCNAACSFCANPTMKRKKMHMTSDIFEKIIERLHIENQTPEWFWLHCLGEPLLDPDIFQKVHRLKVEFPNSKVGFTSNFSIANADTIDSIFTSGQDYIYISLNAINETDYEQIMHLKYQKTLSNINDLLREKEKRQSEIQIVLSIVETPGNEQQVNLFKENWGTKAEVRVIKQGKWIDSRLKSESRRKRHLVCNQLLEEICILSNGDYALCCFDGEGTIPLGNVMERSLAEMFVCEEKQMIIDQFLFSDKEVSVCAECSFY